MTIARKMTTFRYDQPPVEHGKINTMLARTDLITAGIQLITSGGETNLHAHSGHFESASDEPRRSPRIAVIAQCEEDKHVNYTPLLERQQGMHDGSVNVYRTAN